MNWGNAWQMIFVAEKPRGGFLKTGGFILRVPLSARFNQLCGAAHQQTENRTRKLNITLRAN
jgi:hypothetical protein